MEGKSTS